MDRKAIALISGGLDSLLAAKVIAEQGIEVRGVCFVMSFAARDNDAFRKNVKEAGDAAGIPVEMVDIADDFLDVLKNPAHGYGSTLNPCIDCKIFMLRKAKKMMEETGAGFVITGEVLGERPMSQNRASLKAIKKESGLEGYLLRPLSARLLEETVPETEGIVNRDVLLDINGRSREKQFELAQKYGITKFFTPAGGCLLTDPGFSRRLKDLMAAGDFGLDDVSLLKYGRHFRLDRRTKVVVGRDEKDNGDIISAQGEKDVLFHTKEIPGPYALLRGEVTEASINSAASLCLSHSKGKHSEWGKIEYWMSDDDRKEVVVQPMTREEIDKLRV